MSQFRITPEDNALTWLNFNTHGHVVKNSNQHREGEAEDSAAYLG